MRHLTRDCQLAVGPREAPRPSAMRVRGQGLDNALALFLGALRQTLQCVSLCPLRAIKEVRAEL
jgi:hypothetical protein